MSLDLYKRETAERMMSLRPVQVPEPDAFDGFVRGTGMYAMRTLAKAGSAIDLLGAVGPIAQDAFTGGTEAQDRYFKEHDEVFGSAIDYWTPKPGEVGAAGEVAGTLLGTLPLVLASPSLTVGTTQISTAEELVKKGVDAEKAQVVGGVQALGLGLGIYVPIFGQSLWQRMLLGGAGFNVIQGATMRGASGVILEGTPAADEFKAFDPKMLTLDFLLGLGFGAINHLSPAQRAEGAKTWARMHEWGKSLKPSDIDALATLRQAQHANVDTLPGRPADAGDLQTHVDRLRKATEQVLRGESVNVSDMPAGKFDPVPERFVEAAKRADVLALEAAAVAKAYDIVLERPLGPVNDPLVRLQPEDIGDVLVARGPAVLKNGEIAVEGKGFGLVKFIFRHGEKSTKAPELRLAKEDVTALPKVLREYEPTQISADGMKREYRVKLPHPEYGERSVVFAITRFGEQGDQHVVSAYIERKPTGPFSQNKSDSPGSSGRVVSSTGDTAGDLRHRPTQSQGESPIRTIAPDAEAGKTAIQAGRAAESEPTLIQRVREKLNDLLGTEKPAAVRQEATDPLAAEARRFADENPEARVSVGRDAEGQPITKTVREYLDETRADVDLARRDAKLFEIAATCLMGVA